MTEAGRGGARVTLIFLAVAMAAGSMVTAGVTIGPSLALAVQAYRRERGWMATVALGIAVLAAFVWGFSWWVWSTDRTGAIADDPVPGVLALVVTAFALGALSWVLVDRIGLFIVRHDHETDPTRS